MITAMIQKQSLNENEMLLMPSKQNELFDKLSEFVSIISELLVFKIA